MPRNEIYKYIDQHIQLNKLYKDDITFKKAVDAAVSIDMTIEEMLIFVLREGYVAKHDCERRLIENAMLK